MHPNAHQEDNKAMTEPHFHRFPNETPKPSTSPFSVGMARWCAICGSHQPQIGGTLRHMMGSRHWVCAKHPKPTPKPK